MRALFQFAAAGLLLVLAGCQTGQTVSFDRLQPEAIRPGLTAAQIAALRPAPDGLRKRWRLAGSETFEALAPVMEVRLARAGQEIRWTGNIKFRLPGTDIAQIAREIEQATGRKAPVEGNRALIPVSMASDLKGRITRFQFFGTAVSYTPHDCQNVVGECKSLWRDTAGRTRRVIVRTTESGGRWFTLVRLDPAYNLGSARAIEQRIYSIDRFGLYRDASIYDLEEGGDPYFLIGL